MEVHYNICSKSILSTLLTVLLLACARGESDNAFQDEAGMPSDPLSDVNATVLPMTTALPYTPFQTTRRPWRPFTTRRYRPFTTRRYRPTWRRFPTRRPTYRPQNVSIAKKCQKCIKQGIKEWKKYE
jgi:hypothetical protein